MFVCDSISKRFQDKGAIQVLRNAMLVGGVRIITNQRCVRYNVISYVTCYRPTFMPMQWTLSHVCLRQGTGPRDAEKTGEAYSGRSAITGGTLCNVQTPPAPYCQHGNAERAATLLEH